MSRRLAALAALAAVLVPIVLYLPTLRFGFVFDDRPLLIDNPVVQSPRGLGELLTTDLDPLARTSETPTTNYLRPLFLGMASGLYRLFRDTPRGWHATAIGLHGLLAGLAFLLLRREAVGVLTALAAALLFGFHPAHMQCTAWVSGLQDLLFGVTALAAFLAYRRSIRRPRAATFPLLVLGLAFAVALLAKEPAIGLILFVAAEAGGWMPLSPELALGRKPRAELLVLSGVACAYFAYRFSVLGGLAHAFPTAPAWPTALASVPVAVLAYFKDLVWPVGLFLLHPARPVASPLSRESLVAALGFVGMLAALYGSVRWRPILARPICWAAAWLAPVLALWAVNPEWMVMDRYLLLPSLGLVWAIALLLPLEGARSPLRASIWIALLVACAGLSLAGMRPFGNEDRFWSAAIHADPGSSTAWTEWARRRSEAGDLVTADEALQRAVALDPRAQLPRLRQALLALRRGDARAAVSGLEDLIRRNAGYLPAWRNLVVAEARAGNLSGADDTLTRALALFPDDSLLWTQRAIVLRQSGRREESLAAIQRAASLAPHDAALALREASLLAELDRGAEAAAAARRGLLLDPAPEIRVALEPLARLPPEGRAP